MVKQKENKKQDKPKKQEVEKAETFKNDVSGLSCKNPWKKDKHDIKKGENPTDIGVFITYKDENLPICKSCWLKIADSDYEWGNSPTPNFESQK